MGAEMYKTYAVQAPRSTHQRRARCEEVDCQFYANGWQVTCDENLDLGMRQAAYIRSVSGRRFQESHEGGLTIFRFYPEQQCFQEHYVSLHREPEFLVLGGDWRGNPRGTATQVHRNFDDWANDFGDHQDTLKKAQS